MPEILTSAREDFEQLFAEAIAAREQWMSVDAAKHRITCFGWAFAKAQYPGAFAFACSEMGIPAAELAVMNLSREIE